ncbi:hypothetical protein C1H46_022611 [Malus baccata]|uniref:HMG box domain-containing protein n=1 Tax=Malus baccata TaxID=106549 RepID=A0A540LZP4_MALBA|nr:hypothetical protein C1H46_022611 [Malus baccata]
MKLQDKILIRHITVTFQVTADERWGEVALALKLDGDNLQDPQPLLNLYVHILYQYEKLYYYREPHVKAAFTLGHAFYNTGDVSAIERKCRDNSSQMLVNLENALVEKRVAKEMNWQPKLIGSTSAEQKQFPQLHSQKKEMKRRRGFPRGTQSAYTIFLRKECERLKNSASEQLKGQRILDLAVKAWRCLSESEKQPYIEASKRVNEKRAAQEMTADEENHGMQNAERGKKPSHSHNGNCRAALQSDTEKSCVQIQAVNFQESLLEGIDWKKMLLRGMENDRQLMNVSKDKVGFGTEKMHRVTTDERWGEVALALKLDGDNLQDPQPLLKLYALFLYQYEQLYYYREPHGKAASTLGHGIYSIGDSSAMEGQCSDNSCQMLPNLENALAEKKMPKKDFQPTLIGSTSSEQKLFPQLSSKRKEMKKRCGAPRGAQSGYHIYLRKECERLKSTDAGKLKGQNFRAMADNAWRSFSETEKLPYIEASKKVNGKRLAQEVTADEENQGMQNAEREKKAFAQWGLPLN